MEYTDQLLDNSSKIFLQELYSSLTDIYGMACFMHEESLTDKQRKYLTHILHSIDHLLTLVEKYQPSTRQ